MTEIHQRMNEPLRNSSTKCKRRISQEMNQEWEQLEEAGKKLGSGAELFTISLVGKKKNLSVRWENTSPSYIQNVILYKNRGTRSRQAFIGTVNRILLISDARFCTDTLIYIHKITRYINEMSINKKSTGTNQ